MNRLACSHAPDLRACLVAALLSCMSGFALANPTGAEVVQGSAGFATAGSVLTVTPAANTVIQWRSFNIAPGETVRFVQPAGATVLNRVPEGGLSIGGGIESAGRVLFLTGSSVSGGGIQLDLAGSVDSSLRLRPQQATQRLVERPEQGERPVMLTGDRVFVIGAASVMRGPAGRTLLVPGASAEIGQLSLPNVRVFVAAPPGSPVDLDALVARRPATGIFNALFAPRPGPRGEGSGTAVARAPSAPVEERAVLAFAAPVEERIPTLLPVIFAPVEERVAIAVAAPLEERAVQALAMPVTTAPVEERLVIAFAAPVEERGMEPRPLVPAPVEEKSRLSSLVTAAAPVEDRQVMVVWIAPVEDRVARTVARPDTDALKLAAVAVERLPVAEPGHLATGDGLIRVASAAPAPVALSAPVPAASPSPEVRQQTVVRLPEVRRRMPRIMMDHKGGIFHL